MVDGADAAEWSDVASGWSELWGGVARPVQDALMVAARVAPGTRVLDVGCGSGEFLAVLRSAGADPTGVDPAAGMRALARSRGFEVHPGHAQQLPFPDASFDVVTAVNALQFAGETSAALREFTRVIVPGGRIAVANWAEGGRNDIDVIERAIAAADESEHPPDGPLRRAGGLEAAFAAAGLRLVASGVVDTPWSADDESVLVRGMLLGEDPATVADLSPAVVAAAAPFRTRDGFLLRNAFRWAVGRL